MMLNFSHHFWLKIRAPLDLAEFFSLFFLSLSLLLYLTPFQAICFAPTLTISLCIFLTVSNPRAHFNPDINASNDQFKCIHTQNA